MHFHIKQTDGVRYSIRASVFDEGDTGWVTIVKLIINYCEKVEKIL